VSPRQGVIQGDGPLRQGKGALEVKFFNDDDLERILQIMGLELE
jgi:hypothetical protein